MEKICIKGTVYSYFEKLFRSLDGDGARQLKMLEEVRRMAGKKAGDESQSIQIVPDDVYLDQLAIPENKFITRAMVKNAYKMTKEEGAI